MINNYLISNCLLVIDEFNEIYKKFIIENEGLKEEEKRKLSEELSIIADTEYNEADIVVKLGNQFRNMAHFNMQSKSNDIVLKSKDFIVEVKYLCRYKSRSKNQNLNSMANKMTWKEAFVKDWSWLCDEIKGGNKGKRAFLISWFNCYKTFGNIMQLGEGTGKNPLINKDRLKYFPFLNYNGNNINNLFYQYSSAYKPLSITVDGYDKESAECMFFGKKDDILHFAMYW